MFPKVLHVQESVFFVTDNRLSPWKGSVGRYSGKKNTFLCLLHMFFQPFLPLNGSCPALTIEKSVRVYFLQPWRRFQVRSCNLPRLWKCPQWRNPSPWSAAGEKLFQIKFLLNWKYSVFQHVSSSAIAKIYFFYIVLPHNIVIIFHQVISSSSVSHLYKRSYGIEGLWY